MQRLPVENIYVVRNVRQARDESLPELAASMETHGQQDPIHVYKFEGGWAVKNGHRRLAAAKLNGWDYIDALVVDEPIDPGELRLQQMIHNEQRRGLSYTERAEVFRQLKDEDGWTQTAIAQQTGLSETYVSLALAALRSHPDLLAAIEEGRIDPSVAKALFSLDPEDQARLLPTAIREKTARRVEVLVRTEREKQQQQKQQVERETDIAADVDPLEVLTLAELDEALVHLRNVQQTTLQHPELRKAGRKKVSDLIQMAQSIKKELK